MTPALRALLKSPSLPVVTKITNAELIATRKEVVERLDRIINVVNSGDSFERITRRVAVMADDLAELVLDKLLPLGDEEEE